MSLMKRMLEERDRPVQFPIFVLPHDRTTHYSENLEANLKWLTNTINKDMVTAIPDWIDYRSLDLLEELCIRVNKEFDGIIKGVASIRFRDTYKRLFTNWKETLAHVTAQDRLTTMDMSEVARFQSDYYFKAYNRLNW